MKLVNPDKLVSLGKRLVLVKLVSPVIEAKFEIVLMIVTIVQESVLWHLKT